MFYYNLYSHPGMLVPQDMQPESVLDKGSLVDSSSSENWSLPAAIADGYTIVWLKPAPKACRTLNGYHTLKIGKERG